MGGGGSTRRVTVEQDDHSGMVKVSEAVARRLMGQPDVPEDKQGFPQEQQASRRLTAKEKEEFKVQEQKYRETIKKLERKNAELYQTTSEQFAKAVEEVEQKFLKTTASPICQELQEEVLKCYQSNPKYTLYCSPQVKAFNECVERTREKILTRKG